MFTVDSFPQKSSPADNRFPSSQSMQNSLSKVTHDMQPDVMHVASILDKDTSFLM
jgi:hypothetical protein